MKTFSRVGNFGNVVSSSMFGEEEMVRLRELSDGVVGLGYDEESDKWLYIDNMRDGKNKDKLIKCYMFIDREKHNENGVNDVIVDRIVRTYNKGINKYSFNSVEDVLSYELLRDYDMFSYYIIEGIKMDSEKMRKMQCDLEEVFGGDRNDGMWMYSVDVGKSNSNDELVFMYNH